MMMENGTMVQWTEVDPAEFETYPAAKPAKGRDDIDDILDAVAAGQTVRLTLDGDAGLRGRRMSLGRRAKKRGFSIEMRYQENRIIVRKKPSTMDVGVEEPSATEQTVSATAEPEARPRSAPTRGSKRQRA